MKIRNFNVSADETVEFAELLCEYDLEGVIIGTNYPARHTKKRDFVNKDKIPAFVIPAGFKPTTFRTGI